MGRAELFGAGGERADSARISLATGRAVVGATGGIVMPMGAACAGFAGSDSGVLPAMAVRGGLAEEGEEVDGLPVGSTSEGVDVSELAAATVFSEVGAGVLARGGIASEFAPTGSTTGGL